MNNSNERIARLTALGQSLWLDNITRHMIESGDLAAMIERGDIRGVTSNPTIFNQAIGKSGDYDGALMPLAWAGWDPERIFWQLAAEDITAACDLFRPVYDQSGGGDGFVSIEVSPLKARDTSATIAQVRELWQAVDRPNLMVKIPATEEGIPAIHECIAAGININITLIFSLERYAEVMEAYISGLEKRAASGQAVDRIASVASFFVSRVDTKIDARLPEETPLRGRAGIANAKLAYRAFEETFSGSRFVTLRAIHAARVQRPLWASTSTKNPAYPDTLYADNLIGPDTVDTIPPQTLEAFRDHGTAEITLTRGVEEAARTIDELNAAGIRMAQVTQELEDEGVKSFADSFNELIKTIQTRRQNAVDQLGLLAESVSECIASAAADSSSARLHDGDPTLWTDDPDDQSEIRARLGWLGSPETSRTLLPDLSAFAEQVAADDFTHVLLLGMGGSSLAPEVMSLMFPPMLSGEPRRDGGLSLSVLDSTDPAQIAAAEARGPLDKTLFILSSKSGGTAEVNALFDYFWAKTGANGSQWIAITDPGTLLEKLAIEKGFRRAFLADPNVGGRYSALTAFGLVPAALMGIDVTHLLERSDWMSAQCAKAVVTPRNPGLALGALMGQAALAGRDKLTIVADELFAPFGAWAEQLIAESSGKEGRGIVPVVDEPLGEPEAYGNDRLFIHLRSGDRQDAALTALRAVGHPVVVLPVHDAYDLGSECYRWEVAVAFACSILGVNAFDQPDVQDAKDRTLAKIDAYRQSGSLSEPEPAWSTDGIGLFSPAPLRGHSLPDALEHFLSKVERGDYVGINAYLPRNPDTASLLDKLRLSLRLRTGCATTLGYGPRFLHSTGQLHKGGADNGVFIQITRTPAADIDIPTQGLSFGVLQRAQALGDYEALAARGRRILRIQLEDYGALGRVLEALS
jgi:transaldolase/glucose-6-phosphate isomerase